MTKQKINPTYFNLLHAIKAAGNVAGENRVIVFGSNAILPWLEQNMKLENSLDFDVTFFEDENGKKTDEVDGCLGESSTFHYTFGYWVHGVQIDETRFPKGWKTRLIEIREDFLDEKVGYVLSPPDLAAIKLVAGREKDIKFVTNLLFYKLTNESSILHCISLLPKRKEFAKSNLDICKKNVKLMQNEIEEKQKKQREETEDLSL